MSKDQPNGAFDLINDSPVALRLRLEPEGAEFVLSPREVVTVRLFGESPAIAMKHWSKEGGEACISFWRDKGDYELYFKGKRVWDIL